MNKLPLKSINGRRCLTKCNDKGDTYLHPIFLTGISSKFHDSCAIDPVYKQDPRYFKNIYNLLLTDTCRLEDNKIFLPPDEIESMLLTFYFNPSDFLENIYDLYSFDQVIYWTLENNHLPFDTIKRVHNSAWKAYGNKIEELSSVVLDYYYDIAKTHWLRDYTKIIQNKYSFNLTTTTTTTTDDGGDGVEEKKLRDDKPVNVSDEIYNIISSKFLTYNFFIKSVKKYIYQYQDEWETIDSHYGKLKAFVFNQLIEYIEQETNQK